MEQHGSRSPWEKRQLSGGWKVKIVLTTRSLARFVTCNDSLNEMRIDRKHNPVCRSRVADRRVRGSGIAGWLSDGSAARDRPDSGQPAGGRYAIADRTSRGNDQCDRGGLGSTVNTVTIRFKRHDGAVSSFGDSGLSCGLHASLCTLQLTRSVFPPP